MQRIDTNTDRFRQTALRIKVWLQQFFSSEMPAWAFFLDFVVYPPLVLFCLYLAMAGAETVVVADMAGLFIFGFMLWTLVEYLTHRFAFHHAPVLKSIHMAHHDAPRALTGTPTVVTVLVFWLLVYLPLENLTGGRSAAALTGGIILGYLAYVLVHYVVHNLGSGGSRAIRRLIKLHAVHHHDTAHNFGVTTAFWDMVFGTLAPRRAATTTRGEHA